MFCFLFVVLIFLINLTNLGHFLQLIIVLFKLFNLISIYKIYKIIFITFIFLMSSVKADLDQSLINKLEEGRKLIFIRYNYTSKSVDLEDFNLNDYFIQKNLNDN